MGYCQTCYNVGVPFHLTWSCYEDGQLHCGQCSTCLDRKKAFKYNKLSDPVDYQI
ncbi:hypothetical protein CMK12_06685 [Candidatus Poribacteria bacterium]|nr:hypothetical protein [Candidatus Poribacteria bacterium]